TAPTTQGTFHVVATSVVDPTKKATATVRVSPKPKDTKEHKDGKDGKEVAIDKALPIEKLTRVEAVPAVGRPIAQPGAPSAFEAPSVGRAFIRPDERPPMSPSGNGAPS